MKTVNKMRSVRMHLESLYPTFKEWKPKYEFWVLPNTTAVYILPLRNENYKESIE